MHLLKFILFNSIEHVFLRKLILFNAVYIKKNVFESHILAIHYKRIKMYKKAINLYGHYYEYIFIFCMDWNIKHVTMEDQTKTTLDMTRIKESNK